MTREENLQTIREACIRANPDHHGRLVVFRDIRLADVLVTFKTPTHSYACYQKVVEALCGRSQWNMYKDDLIQQSDATLSFLAELLS